MNSLQEIIEIRLPQWLDELAEILKYKSISSTVDGITGIPQCADKFRNIMEACGIQTKTFSMENGQAYIYGELRSDKPDAKTVLFYGHYDVQPAGNQEDWDSDPFEATVIDGRIVARGVADNKGQSFCWIKAVEVYKELYGSLPVNMKFILEGDEEVGSPNLERFLKEQQELLDCELVVSSDAAMHESGRPTIMLGLKACYDVIFEIRTAVRDVHSMHGATLPNAAWRMVELLKSMRSPEGRILIDGFYDDVLLPTEGQLKLLDTIPDAEEDIKKELGVAGFELGHMSGTRNFNYNTVFEPTCNINSLKAGHLGDGNNNVIPGCARVRLDMRLVPNQTPEKVSHLMRAHLKKHGFDDVKIIEEGTEGIACRAPVEHPFVQATIKGVEKVWNEPAVIWPNLGGSGPASAFWLSMGKHFILIPYAAYDQHEHGPNENFRISDFKRGIEATVELFKEYGKL